MCVQIKIFLLCANVRSSTKIYQNSPANFTIIIFLMLIFYFLLNKKIYEIYEYTYDIRKIFLVLYEIRKFEKYIRNANTSNQ